MPRKLIPKKYAVGDRVYFTYPFTPVPFLDCKSGWATIIALKPRSIYYALKFEDTPPPNCFHAAEEDLTPESEML